MNEGDFADIDEIMNTHSLNSISVLFVSRSIRCIMGVLILTWIEIACAEHEKSHF